MKVRVTINVDERMRKALAHHYGNKGSASREDIARWIIGQIAWDDILLEYDCAKEAEAESSTRGDVHEGCGGTWDKPEASLEASMPGLVDRCTRCGEERA